MQLTETFIKAKNKVQEQVDTFQANLAVYSYRIPILAAVGTVPFLVMDTYANNLNNAIKTMVNLASTVVMGVGSIYAVIAIFNWVSAIRQEDAERQSKAIVNVFVAALLIAIKPITKLLISQLGGDATLADDGDVTW